jgi:hypothetical protein
MILIFTRNLWSSIQTGIHVDAPPTSYIVLIPILLYHRFMGLNPEQDPKDYCFGFGRRSASRSFFIMCLLIVGLAEFALASISRTHRSGLTSPNLLLHSTSQKQSGQTAKLLFRWQRPPMVWSCMSFKSLFCLDCANPFIQSPKAIRLRCQTSISFDTRLGPQGASRLMDSNIKDLYPR